MTRSGAGPLEHVLTHQHHDPWTITWDEFPLAARDDDARWDMTAASAEIRPEEQFRQRALAHDRWSVSRGPGIPQKRRGSHLHPNGQWRRGRAGLPRSSPPPAGG